MRPTLNIPTQEITIPERLSNLSRLDLLKLDESVRLLLTENNVLSETNCADVNILTELGVTLKQENITNNITINHYPFSTGFSNPNLAIGVAGFAAGVAVTTAGYYLYNKFSTMRNYVSSLGSTAINQALTINVEQAQGQAQNQRQEVNNSTNVELLSDNDVKRRADEAIISNVLENSKIMR